MGKLTNKAKTLLLAVLVAVIGYLSTAVVHIQNYRFVDTSVTPTVMPTAKPTVTIVPTASPSATIMPAKTLLRTVTQPVAKPTK